MALVKPFFILLILPFLVGSLADQNEASRNSNCMDSEPFLIKNRAAKAKKPYLTVNLKTNAVNGGKKTGKVNQQWMWRDCDSGRTLVNVATGNCLAKKGKRGVVSECGGDESFFYYSEEDNRLSEELYWTWARLVRRKSAFQFAKKIRFFKGTSTP